MILDLYGKWIPPKEVEMIIKDQRFLRLFDIAQEGPARYLGHIQNRNRGNHSLGVAYLISKLRGNDEEIIAGVIHDIGHFPMAHAIDNEFSKEAHNTHEREDVLKIILENWKVGNYDLFEVSKNIKKGKYKILENEAPKVCADRLEYPLRDGYYFNYISREEVKEIVNDIKFNGEEITFSRENAIKFFELYFKLNINHYMDDKEAILHAIYGKLIKETLGRLKIGDLLKMTDTELNQFLLKYYPELEKIKNIKLVQGNEYTIYPKYRIVDPLTHEGERVSEFYEKFEERKRILKEKSKPRSFRVIVN